MRQLSLVLLLVLVGCGGGDDDSSGTDSGVPPMVRTDCSGIQPMDLGRCALDGGGECVGATGESYGFGGLSSGASMSMVVGPQGSTMLVFIARATGIDPGNPDMPRDSGNPLVEVALLDVGSGMQLSLYRQRVGFTSEGGSLVSQQLWVVIDDASVSTLTGRAVVARATVRDAAGEERCGLARVVPQR